ncbi:hypothetical protein IKN40_05690 [bacterium]|nr:hypothetical protein [bacterium]
MCSCSVTFESCLVGVIVFHPHEAGGIISHCAVKVTVTQSSVVTQVHSGTILYNAQFSDCHHLNTYHSLVTFGRFIFSQYVALISFAVQAHQFTLNLIV